MKRFPRLPAPSSPVHHVTRVTVLTVVRLAVLFSVVMFAAGCSNGDGSPASSTAAGDVRMAERVGLTMGSSLKLGIPTTDPAAAEQAFDAVFAEFNRLDALLSVWKPGSDVLRVNGAAGIEPTTVGDDTMAVLEIAKQISEWTEGTFDVTFGAMADIWKFDHDQDNRVPSREEVDARRPLIDYRAIHLDPPGHTALLERHGMKIHLGGIGKGYAVEKAVGILRDRGFKDFLIQAGGDLYVGGMANGRPWRLGIADPRAPEKSFGTLDLSDGTFSTSGDYERTFIKDGVRYHHIIDPRTGYPATGMRSVTIVTNRPVLADGLSKGVFILGPARGMALVERLPDVEAILVTDKNEVLVSSGLKDKFRQTSPPTDGL